MVFIWGATVFVRGVGCRGCVVVKGCVVIRGGVRL